MPGGLLYSPRPPICHVLQFIHINTHNMDKCRFCGFWAAFWAILYIIDSLQGPKNRHYTVILSIYPRFGLFLLFKYFFSRINKKYRPLPWPIHVQRAVFFYRSSVLNNKSLSSLGQIRFFLFCEVVALCYIYRDMIAVFCFVPICLYYAVRFVRFQ